MATVKHIRLYAEMAHSYNRGVLLGVARYARENPGWDVSFSYDFAPGLTKSPQFAERLPQGILITLNNADLWHELQTLNIPLVNISNLLDPMVPVPLVTVDDFAVGKLAANYFLTRGFRSFAYIGLPKFRFSQKRLEGFAATLASAGLGCQSLPCELRKAPSGERPWDLDKYGDLLRQMPKPMALFGCYDVLASEIAAVIVKLGYVVPDEVAIVGVDDDEIFCGLSCVPMSSIRLPMVQIGYQAASVLAQLMDGQAASAQPILLPPTEVITRRSSDIHVTSDAEVAAVMRYIRQCDGGKINVSDLVKQTKLSRRALEMRFRAALGRSPHQEICRVQMERAAMLLARIDNPTGFANAGGAIDQPDASSLLSHFSSFHPRQYRRRRKPAVPQPQGAQQAQ